MLPASACMRPCCAAALSRTAPKRSCADHAAVYFCVILSEAKNPGSFSAHATAHLANTRRCVEPEIPTKHHSMVEGACLAMLLELGSGSRVCLRLVSF